MFEADCLLQPVSFSSQCPEADGEGIVEEKKMKHMSRLICQIYPVRKLKSKPFSFHRKKKKITAPDFRKHNNSKHDAFMNDHFNEQLWFTTKQYVRETK